MSDYGCDRKDSVRNIRRLQSYVLTRMAIKFKIWFRHFIDHVGTSLIIKWEVPVGELYAGFRLIIFFNSFSKHENSQMKKFESVVEGESTDIIVLSC
jgi:hypothetical protein